MNDENKKEIPGGKPTTSTPTYVRVLALVGAVAVLALSVAYAWSIATGGIFTF